MYTNSVPRPQRGYGPRMPKGHAMARPPLGSDRLSDRMESRNGSSARHFQHMPIGPPHHHQGTFNSSVPPNYETRSSYSNHNRGYQNHNQMSFFVAESPLSMSHEENVKYVYEDWLRVESELRKSIPSPDASAGPVQYYQAKVPNSHLDGFHPFDFDLWYASNCGKQ